MNGGWGDRRHTVAAVCAAIAVVSAALFPVTTPAQARQSAAANSARLESVQVSGSSRFSSAQIVAATSLHVGSDVTREDLQKAADTLAQLGAFASVNYRFGSTDTGVRAEYQVTDAPAVPVWFDNFPWFTDDEILTALKSTVPLFDGKSPEHGTLLDALADAIENLLVRRGAPAQVSHELMAAPLGNERIQVFRAEIPGLNVASVEFSDPLAQNDRVVQQLLPDLVGKPYSRIAVEVFEFEHVQPTYLARAFLRVRFGSPTAKLADGAGNTRVNVSAPIDPGPTFAFNGVTWNGNKAITTGELLVLLPLRPGDPADGMKMEAGWHAIRDAYAHRGFLDAELTATPQFDDDAKRVTYVVAITEGPQYRMGKLVLTGLSTEGERRIRGAWKLAPGAVFDSSAFDDFLDTGIRQAFMGLPFHYEKIGRFLQKDPQAGSVDVLLDFQ